MASVGPSGALARTWLRRNVAVTLLLAALVALVVGASGGAFAGARRAASTLDRFLAYNQPPDVQVFTMDGSSMDVEAVTSLPGVLGWGTGAYGMLSAEGPGGGPFPPGDVNPFVPIAGGGDQPYRPHVVAGRVPRQDRPHEVALDEEAARRLGADVGETITLRLYTPPQMELMFGGGDFPPPQGPEVETTLTGIVRHAFDVTPEKPEDVEAVQLASSEVYPTIAFWDRYGHELAAYGDGTDGVELLLEGGTEAVAEFEAAVSALPGGDALVVEAGNDALTAVDDARQAVRFEAVATAVFGAVILAAGVVLVGQAIARQVRAELDQGDVLRGIGLTRRDVALAAAVRMSVVAVVGAVAGLALAYSTSAAMPFGTAAKAEIDPGLVLDPLPLAGAAASVIVLLVLWSARAAWRVQRPAPPASDAGLAGRLAAAAAGAGAPVPVVFGLSQLGRGRVRTPVRSSLGGVTFAIAAVVAVAVYSSTTDRFVGDPAEHGWGWDLLLGDSDDETLAASGAELLAEDPDVAGFASVWSGSQEVVSARGGRTAAVTAVEPVAGQAYVQLSVGRPAEADDEVVLGRRTMDQLDVELGGDVVLEGPRGRGSYEVVGIAVLHQVMNDGFELDQGAVMSRAGMQQLFDDEMQLDRFIVDLEPGAEPTSAMASLREIFGPTVTPAVPPLDVASLRGTQHLPVLLGLVIGAIGAGSLVHLLLVTIRGRRVQFAVLRALGAVPSQLSSAVASMASTTVVAAAVVGVPAGLVVGRSAWRTLADGIGAPTAPVVPVWGILAGALVVVAVANAIAAVPGHRLGSVPPADALRSE